MPCLFISIHAPAWGATSRIHSASITGSFQSTRPRGARLTFSSFRFLLKVFQSTRPRGARQTMFDLHVFFMEFQSTRPRGARQDTATVRNTTQNFNPRARVGRDLKEKSLG